MGGGAKSDPGMFGSDLKHSAFEKTLLLPGSFLDRNRPPASPSTAPTDPAERERERRKRTVPSAARNFMFVV